MYPTLSRLVPLVIESLSKPGSRDDALAAWRKKYPTASAHVILQSGDRRPVREGRHLGSGGNGQVNEAMLGGTVVALKRTWFRGKPGPRYTAERKILEKLALDQHHHIVSVIGSYVLPGPPSTELGLLLWPVAQYDLARLLTELESLSAFLQDRPYEAEKPIPTSDEFETLEELRVFTGLPVLKLNEQSSDWVGPISATIDAARVRLRSSMGCIAQAMRYLHEDHRIRHKDLKPSQILLSAEGLWLTDFGWSLDTSDATNSATSDGERITVKYHAPERQAMQSCGRPEDIFGLGCVYLEIVLNISSIPWADCVNPRKDSTWSYWQNLDQTEDWLQQLPLDTTHVLGDVKPLIRRMLAPNPEDRPNISETIQCLRASSEIWKSSGSGIFRKCPPMFGECCY